MERVDKSCPNMDINGQSKTADTRYSAAVRNAMETYSDIMDAVTNPKAKTSLKPLFSLPDVWNLLGGKDGNSKEAKRAQRDLANLVLMKKVYVNEKACPTCGTELGTAHYRLQPVRWEEHTPIRTDGQETPASKYRCPKCGYEDSPIKFLP
jgi:predicted RNA-binding Zn-ribbon protein involved in translation (DUF1610 family)